MPGFKSYTEIHLGEQVNASIVTSMIEKRRKSITSLIAENQTLRDRVEDLEQRIIDLEEEIVTEHPYLLINSFHGEGGEDDAALESTVCNILNRILPSKPNPEQMKAYLHLLGQSKAKITLEKYANSTVNEVVER